MIKVTVIALSRLKEKYLFEASREYEKRLSRYCRLEIIEIPPVKLPEKPTAGQIEAALESEALMIEKKIPAGSKVTALCIEGDQLSSEEFSDEIFRAGSSGEQLVYIIGSSHGLSSGIKQRALRRLSVSKMTFPHQLFRVMLLEQIYRGFKIIEGGSYHK